MNIYRKENPPTGFYVYAYLRKSDLTPYYIGKGTKNRVHGRHHISIPKDPTKIVILEQSLTEIGSLALERRLIRWWGRRDLGTGILRNKSDGGEGNTGLKQTDDTKKRIGDSSRGKPGRKWSDEEKHRHSVLHSGVNHQNYGIPHSAERKANISASVKKTYYKILVACVKCRTVTTIGNYTKHHGSNCKRQSLTK